MLDIVRLGRHGDGIAEDPAGGAVYVAGALPGERVEADVRAGRGALQRVIAAAPERARPPCPHFGVCGGCSAQHIEPGAYARWKRAIVRTALENRGLNGVEPDQLIDAHGAGRRRVTLHVECERNGARVGFMRQRSHALLEIAQCPVLAPGLERAFDAGRELAGALKSNAAPKRFDAAVTLTETGLDVALTGVGELDFRALTALSDAADRLDLARLTADAEPVVTRRAPILTVGAVKLTPSAGGFLQATAAGEAQLAQLVVAHVGDAARVIDLFAGAGPFALRLAGHARVHAVDTDAAALASLDAAWRGGTGLKAVTTEVRDLFENPVDAVDLAVFDAAVFDPPRAGAELQVREIANSGIETVVAVSCEPATFARDAEILIGGGYALARVTPVDQFRYTGHVEVVGLFRKR